MQRRSGLAFVAAMTMFCGGARAQMSVHAMSGTVKAINPSAKTMDVAVESGDMSEFKLPTNAKVTLDFDKALESDATDASKFENVGDFVVVYYYGYDDNRTAVAVKDLGKGTFDKIQGNVVGFDRHTRMMTVKDDGGKTETFELGDHLVVDSGITVESGRGYGPHKGDQVRVTYTKNGDKNTAVFVRSWQ